MSPPERFPGACKISLCLFECRRPSVGPDLVTHRAHDDDRPEPSVLRSRGGQVLVQPADLLAVLVDAPIVPVRIAREAQSGAASGALATKLEWNIIIM